MAHKDSMAADYFDMHLHWCVRSIRDGCGSEKILGFFLENLFIDDNQELCRYDFFFQ